MNIFDLGKKSYPLIWQAMRTFTEHRKEEDEDELWFVEHPPVYTQGQAGRAEHLLKQTDIPVIQSDRGGQVTYHGPGQIVLYTLLDLARHHIKIRAFVTALENTIIQLLRDYQIEAQSRCDAPGVYIQEKKIASIGLRVKKGYTYHGIAFNVDMDLTPFQWINPCGKIIQMTQLREYTRTIDIPRIKKLMIEYFFQELGYNGPQLITERVI